MSIFMCYKDYRGTVNSGRSRLMENEKGEMVEVFVGKGEMLEIEEVDRAIRHLIGVATELDPDWKLESAPL